MTTYPPLVVDTDLAAYPGAPFDATVIGSVQAGIRREAGWHIAPVFRETVSARPADCLTLILRTLRIVEVYSVTDPDGNQLSDYEVDPGGWIEVGPQASWLFDPTRRYTVDLDHGYDDVEDLFSFIALRCYRETIEPTLSQRSETMGARQITESYNINRIDETRGTGVNPLQRYCLPSIG